MAALQSATSLMQELGELQQQQQQQSQPDAFASQQQPLLLPTPQLSPELRGGAPPPQPAWLAAALLQLPQPMAGAGAPAHEASSPARTVAPPL